MNPTTRGEAVERMYFLFSGISNNMTDGSGNQTDLTRAWAALTEQFVYDFWQNYYRSPFNVTRAGTTFVSETRFEEIPEYLKKRTLRLLQLEDANFTNTTNSSNETDNEIPATQPPTDPKTSLTGYLYVDCRMRINYRVVDEFFDLGDYSEADLFMVPFLEPVWYTMGVGRVTKSNEIPVLHSYSIFDPNAVPTSAPTHPPTKAPTGTPSVPPTNPPTLKPTGGDNGNDGSLIAYVVVVVVVSVCVASGYLYYLVRKEDRQPIVGDLPDDLSGRDYFVETRQIQTATGHSRQTSDEANLRPVPEENLPLNPPMIVPEEIRGTPGPGGTMTTATTSAGLTSRLPPSVPALNDVPQESKCPRAIRGNDDDDSVELEGIDDLDGLEPSNSFDSAEGSTPAPPYDLTGFQMNVQNLDDV